MYGMDLKALPDDPSELRQLVAAALLSKDEQLASLRAENEALKGEQQKVAALKAEQAWLEQRHIEDRALIARLRHEIAAATRVRFGRQTEKLTPGQLSLFKEDHAVQIAALEQQLEQLVPEPEPPEPKRKGRKPLPAHLPREERVLDLETEVCDCGHALHRLGEERSETLDYIPASFVVRETVRIKYACRACEKVHVAELPKKPIRKGRPEPGLIAQVVIAKYCDHLPLYRQSQIYQREGVSLTRGTMADWVGRASALLEPVVDRMRALVLTGGKLHTDDTPVRVLEAGKKQVQSSTGRFWAYLLDQSTSDPPGATRPLVVYDYTPSRSAKGPQVFLEGYEGYLQADAYPGYQALYDSERVQEVACWAHARRYFEALLEQPSPIAEAVVARIAELYRIESEIVAGLNSHAERAAARQTHALPLLENLKIYIDETLPTVPAKSAIAEAMGYVAKRWAALTRYCEHGALSIDNNPVERSIRSLAIGRKNWLFAGSHAGGRRAANLYSLINTCKLNDIDPHAYLTDVIGRIPNHDPERIDELLPIHWSPRSS